MILDNPMILFVAVGLAVIATVLYFIERNQKVSYKSRAKRAESVIQQLDEQAKMIIKTDLALNRVREELDKKITGLYTLHELGKKINATFNVEDLFALVNEPLVLKLGFSKSLIMIKDETSGSVMTKSSVGYSRDESSVIENSINENKEGFASPLFKKGTFILVNKDLKKIEHEDALSNIFKCQAFLTVPIVVKDAAIGFIFMGNSSSYADVNKGDAELLSVLASQIGTAMENTKLYTELFGSHQDLERRVKERTAELAKLNEELKKLNKIKSDFVSSVSHELRTPLTSIKGYASILVAGKLGDLTKPQKERLEKIDKHSNNLTRLVNNMLDISRIESGKIQMSIKDSSIKEIMDSVEDLMAPQIKEKNINFETDISKAKERIKADPSQIERVFINLVGNAVKFTPEKGTVTVKAEDKPGFVEFTVKDTGIGMTREDAERIFDEFFRAQSALDKNIKGTGLGLSLVKKIIEAHKGTIWVKSELGKGTEFIFTIPRI